MTAPWVVMLSYFPLIVLVAVAAWTDVRSRRIPNWLTLTVALAGLAQCLTPFALTSGKDAIAGFAVGFVLPLVLYAVGGRGAGDVKLLAGIGAWMGPLPVLYVFAAAAIVSLVVALVQSAVLGKLSELLGNVAVMVLNVAHVRRLGAAHVIGAGQAQPSVARPMPNAVNVLVATIAVAAWLAWTTAAARAAGR